MLLKRFTVILLMLVLCLLFPDVCSAQSNTPELWVSPSGGLTADAIKVSRVNEKYYFFLPGGADLSGLRIGTNADAVLLNGHDLDPTSCTAEVFSETEPNELVFVMGKTRREMTLTVLRGSKIPSVYITTESGSLKKIHRDKANKEPGFIVMHDADNRDIYRGSLKHFKMRGNSSVNYKKKNYAIKLEAGANLLGMGKAKKWALLGNYLDKSFIRNQMNFDTARYVGLGYTPDCRQTALYINNEYMGLYLLTEKIEIDDDRVDIRNLEKETEKLNSEALSSYPMSGSRFNALGNFKAVEIPKDPDDITGGYILEFEHMRSGYDAEPSAYCTKHGMMLIIHAPEYCSTAQAKYISGIMQSFENAIFAKNGIDPGTGKHYSEIVDMDSLVNKYLINEVTKNYDANMSSEYYYKPEDSVSTKVFAGPVWDLDNTYGDYSRGNNRAVLNPETMLASNKGSQDYWWPALYRQPDFYQAVVARYHERFVPALEILLGLREESDTLKSIETYASAIRESAAMEYVLYPELKQKRNQVQTGSNPDENVQYLKDYITKRMAFLSGVWVP